MQDARTMRLFYTIRDMTQMIDAFLSATFGINEKTELTFREWRLNDKVTGVAM